MSNKLYDVKRRHIAKRNVIKLGENNTDLVRGAVLARRNLVRIIFIIIILCFETAPGNKSYLSVEQKINFLFRLTSFAI